MRIRSGHKPEDWIECPPANPGCRGLWRGTSMPWKELGDKPLEAPRKNLQNQGVKSTIPEVQP